MTASQRLNRVDELATRVGSVIADVEALEKAGAKSRHIALAKTKLEEAKHRLADEMGETSNSVTMNREAGKARS